MSHSNAWDVTKPANTELEGNGDNYIRQILLDLKERLALDHNMNGVLDTTLATADGYHKQVTLKALSADPNLITGAAVLYAKSDGLYFRNASGIVKVI